VQLPTFIRDACQLIEGLVWGRYPIILGMRPEVLKEFQEEGVAAKVRTIDVPDVDYLPAFCASSSTEPPIPMQPSYF